MSEFKGDRKKHSGNFLRVTAVTAVLSFAAGLIYGLPRLAAESDDYRKISEDSVSVQETSGFLDIYDVDCRYRDTDESEDTPKIWQCKYTAHGGFTGGPYEIYAAGVCGEKPIQNVCIQDECHEPTNEKSYAIAKAKLDEICEELDCREICRDWRIEKKTTPEEIFYKRLSNE